MNRVLLAILFFGAMVAVYIILFLLNRKTPLPKGCENLKAHCDACHDIHCINNPGHAKNRDA